MKQTLATLLGSYDNLGEPTPTLNKPSVILGLIVTGRGTYWLSPLILAWVCGSLRLWTRFKIVKALGWDDLFMSLALVVTTAGSILVCDAVYHHGLGKHFLLLGSPHKMKVYLKGFYISMSMYLVATTFIKLALLVQYLRLFERGTALYRTCVTLIVAASVWGVAYTILGFFPCSPVSDYWSLNPEAHCWGFGSQNPAHFAASFESHSILNLLFDAIILLLPTPLYFRSGLQIKAKRGLAGMALLGFLVIFVAIWRAVTIIKHHAATVPTFDPSWYGCTSIVLSTLEVDLAVVCASVPVFWPHLQSGGFLIFITQEVHVLSESIHDSEDSDDIQLHASGAPHAGAEIGNITKINHGHDHPEKYESTMDNSSDMTLRNLSTDNSSKKSTEMYNEENGLEHSNSLGGERPKRPRRSVTPVSPSMARVISNGI